MPTAEPSNEESQPLHSAADETTPLLALSSEGPTAQANEELFLHANGSSPSDDQAEEDRPLPKGQLFFLCYTRLVEPIAFFSIFPFINQMIYETGVAEADVGFYSGLIESLFSLTQMLTMIGWGRAADHFGRKPVLVFSLVGVSISICFFGLSKHIWQMILFRCLAGVFSGTVVTVRAMVTEISTTKTQARAFSVFSFMGNVGTFIGPLIGGAFSHPAEQYPFVFGNIQFFKQNPYALPSFVTGVVGLSALITSALFVKETLVRKDESDGKSSKGEMSILELLKYPGVGIVMGIYGLVMLIGIAHTAIVPVFWFTDPKLGGFGFSPLLISIFLGLAGGSQALWLLIAFPPLQTRFGTGTIMRGCALVAPVSFAMSPICAEFLRHGWNTAFWSVAPLVRVVASGTSMYFTGCQLMLNDIAPSAQTMGTLNGMVLTLGSGIRAVAPALFSSLYATGVRNQILRGHLAWLVLISLSVSLIISLRWLPEKAEGKLDRPKTSDDREA